jgi:hypothetical protein
MKKFFLVVYVFFFALPSISLAQFSILRKIPVKPVMDVGFSIYGNPPTNMELKLLGSRAFNLAMLYEVYISDYFTFNTGVGISVERYSFDRNITLRETIDSQNNTLVGVFPINYNDIRKSLLSPTYIDLPVEFRAVTSTGRETFRFIVGFKAGVLVSAKTKIKYGMGDDVRKEKLHDNFFLNRFRYGVYGRVGYKNLHLFTYYSLSDLFQSGKLNPTQEVMPLTFGLSFLMF